MKSCNVLKWFDGLTQDGRGKSFSIKSEFQQEQKYGFQMSSA
jgi:hypothetical protein